MPREFSYTSLNEALHILARNCKIRTRVESVDVKQAFGRTLARDFVARENKPATDSSHFDGFAVRATDISGAAPDAPVSLVLKQGVQLGQIPRARIGEGEASRIPTGGFLPAGTDTVVPLEDARVEEGRVMIGRAVARGGYVYPAGQDVRKGERLLEAGRTLRSQDIVLFASLHAERVSVFVKPRVAILPTGSELTDGIRGRSKGKVVESHSHMLKVLIEGAGGLPLRRGIVPDEKPVLVSRLREALKETDIVLTIAGSSVGQPDLVDSAINSVGNPGVLVHGVRVNRGRVMGFGVVAGTPIVILPGPIQAALNAFIVFGYPLIRNHLGHPMQTPPSIPAIVSEDWEPTGRFRSFDQIVYLELRPTQHGIFARPGVGETEKVSFLLSKDGYTIVPGEKGGLRKGESIWTYLLPGFSGSFGE